MMQDISEQKEKNLNKHDRYDAGLVKVETRPLDQFKCDCNVCVNAGKRQVRLRVKKLNPLSAITQQNTVKVEKVVTEKDYVFIMKRLIPPVKLTRGLRINVPDTCCFTNGRPKFIVFSLKEKRNHNSGVLHYIRQKEKLSFSQIRFFMYEKAKKNDLNVHLTTALSDTREFRNNQTQEIEISIMPMQETRNGFLKPNQVIISHEIEVKQNKPENTDIGPQDKNNKEAVICRFVDGNTQIFNENEFINFMLKRQNDPIFQQLQYIQNYPKVQNLKIEKVKFNFENDRLSPSFVKARIEIMILSNDISKFSEDFIPTEKEEEYELQILNQDVHQFLKYQSFKIVHFIDCFYDFQILKGVFEFMKDDHNSYQFVNAIKVKWQLIKRKKVQQEITPLNPETLLNQSERNSVISEKNKETNQAADILETSMVTQINYKKRDEFLRRKKDLGIVLEKYQVPQDTKSDEQFSQLFPNAPQQFSELIKKQSPQQILTEMWHLHMPSLSKRYMRHFKQNRDFSVVAVASKDETIQKRKQNTEQSQYDNYQSGWHISQISQYKTPSSREKYKFSSLSPKRQKPNMFYAT